MVLVIDIETTGLLPSEDKIVEVAAVFVNLDDLSYEPAFSSLCNPGLSEEDLEDVWICYEEFITPEEILNSDPMTEVARQFKKIVGERLWTCFNLEFEQNFLTRAPWSIPQTKYPCLMKTMTPICAIPMSWGYKWPTLTEAYHTIGGEESSTHRAFGDATKAAEIFIWLVKNKHLKL